MRAPPQAPRSSPWRSTMLWGSHASVASDRLPCANRWSPRQAGILRHAPDVADDPGRHVAGEALSGGWTAAAAVAGVALANEKVSCTVEPTPRRDGRSESWMRAPLRPNNTTFCEGSGIAVAGFGAPGSNRVAAPPQLHETDTRSSLVSAALWRSATTCAMPSDVGACTLAAKMWMSETSVIAAAVLLVADPPQAAAVSPSAATIPMSRRFIARCSPAARRLSR